MLHKIGLQYYLNPSGNILNHQIGKDKAFAKDANIHLRSEDHSIAFQQENLSHRFRSEFAVPFFGGTE